MGKLADLFSFRLCAHTEKERSTGVQRQREREKKRDRDRDWEGRAGEGGDAQREDRRRGCQTFCWLDSAPPGSSVGGKNTGWVAFPFSRETSQASN